MLNLSVLRNTMAANNQYPVRDCENISSLIQMQSVLKPKTFSDSSLSFLESTSNFKHFEKEDDRHRYFILEITNCQRLG